MHSSKSSVLANTLFPAKIIGKIIRIQIYVYIYLITNNFVYSFVFNSLLYFISYELTLHIFSIFFYQIANIFLIDLQELCVFGNLVFDYEINFRHFPSFLLAFAYSGFRHTFKKICTQSYLSFVLQFLGIVSILESFPQSVITEK